MAQRVVIPGFRKIETSGGGEGTSNYDDLTNKPSINNVPLVGNLNTVDLKLTDSTLTEEGVPAEAKTVGAKLEEQSTSLIALKKETTVNLLKPTLQTTTQNGVTCTNNGDGTYTLNGTCTKDDAFILKNNIKINGSYRLVGCPKGEYSLWITSGYPEWVIIGEDTGNGSNFTNSSDFLFDVRINIYENRTYNNVVFKPMLTTNLSATYDDFVPYTGDGETLTHDVASLLKRIETLESIVNKTATTTVESE